MRLSLAVFFTILTASASGQTHQHGYPGPTSASTAPTVSSVTIPGPVVHFPSTLAGEAGGYLALPAGAATKPAIIVVPEWYGLNDWIRQQTDRLAKQGYVALAVDLYRGKTATTNEEAHELSRALPEDRAMADLASAFKYLASRKDVDPARIGVLGWCMGGGYALALATQEPRLAAAVINYGRLVTDPATIAKIKAPILGNFGAKDRGIPVASITTFEEALKAAGRSADIKVYADAGHAFMNPNNKDGYRAESATDAQERIDRFFAAKLRANIPNS